MPSGLFYINSLERSIFNRMGVMLIYVITMFYIKKKSPVSNANGMYPIQTPRSAASDQGLSYLQMSLCGLVQVSRVDMGYGMKIAI